MKVFGCWRIGFLGALIGALAACDVERPDTVLSDSVMENVLYDYHIAKALGEQKERGENYKRVLYVDYVYQKHGITKAQFDSSMVWFSRHPDVLGEVYRKVTERLRAEEANIEWLVAMREHKPLTSLAGDSVDLWAWQPVYQLSGMPMDNRLTFSFPSDSNFKARDTLRWSVHFTFAGSGARDSLHAPVMALQMRFANDSVIGDFVQVREEGRRILTLTGDTLGDIKEVSGFVYYPRQDSVRPLVLDCISLTRYHAHGADSLALTQDSLEADAPAKDKALKTEQQAKPVRTEAAEEPKKEEPRRLSPSEMRRSQGAQEQSRKKEATPRRREVNSPQPVTRLKQNVKIRKVDE